ncbi:hypothetical protein [Actinoplanes sichuanensis]|uniref:Uncharacterized protein n=1 Tax=Actinoplanes sichuanensis TaxID=512349 RepID=A0ABW4ATF1_9ACTN
MGVADGLGLLGVVGGGPDFEVVAVEEIGGEGEAVFVGAAVPGGGPDELE